ncbi:hypothetical protein [Roseateles sp.]|uniref:hypothetical protein n=1 Tax=Roseateles sp. TaxID=1971397 RepID=UPI003BA41B7D
MNHQLLGIDEGRQQLYLIDTAKPDFGWTLDLADFPCARDMQRIGWDRALVGFERGFFEVNIFSGKVLTVCDRWSGVTAVTRRPDGSTLVTGMNLDGTDGVNVLTLNREFDVLKNARRDGNYVRLMRLTPQGSYLLSTNDRILETDTDLNLRREFVADGFEHAWLAQRMPDGSTLVTAGYGACFAQFDADGGLIRRFGTAEQLPSQVAPFFYAAFQFLPSNTVLVANWQGHGPDNGNKGQQLLEFGLDGELLATWSDPARISSLQGILVLS